MGPSRQIERLKWPHGSSRIAFFFNSGFGDRGVDVNVPFDQFPGVVLAVSEGQASVPNASPADGGVVSRGSGASVPRRTRA